MITPANAIRIFLVTRPVDFRKGMGGLASFLKGELGLEPLNEAIYVLRSKRADRLKMLVWDGTGLELIYKRIETSGFRWPQITDGTLKLTKTQFEALFEGIDWRRVAEARPLPGVNCAQC